MLFSTIKTNSYALATIYNHFIMIEYLSFTQKIVIIQIYLVLFGSLLREKRSVHRDRDRERAQTEQEINICLEPGDETVPALLDDAVLQHIHLLHLLVDCRLLALVDTLHKYRMSEQSILRNKYTIEHKVFCGYFN